MSKALENGIQAEPTLPSLVNTKISRRGFVKAGIGSAVVAGLALPEAKAGTGFGAGTRRPLRGDPVVFLANHITQGFSQPWFDRARFRGYQGLVEEQLNPERIDDSDLDALLAQYPSLGMSYGELYANYTKLGLDYVVYYELKLANLLRSIYSSRQLFERMVEFWTDHFNIDHNKDGEATFKTVDDREVIRQHALGKFPDLLMASATSGAMMVYLDNYLNTKYGANENYAREVMELHTLGVDGGYTEKDVKELARCLTGWSIDYTEANYGNFAYYDYLHDKGSKTVLGYFIAPNGGKNDAEYMLWILSQLPSTAKFISKKMCRWLLSYEPSDNLLAKVTDTFIYTGGDIKEMIRTIFLEALAEPINRQDAKLRRPYHHVMSLVRALQPEITDITGLFYEMYPLGQMPYDWAMPTGYPDSFDAWGSALLPRWTFANRLLENQIYGIRVKPAIVQGMLGNIPNSQLGEGINHLLTGGTMAREDVRDVQAFLDSIGVYTWTVLRQAIALAASCASYQLY
jgi:hypothetical protein